MSPSPSPDPVLRIEELSAGFTSEAGAFPEAVDRVSLEIGRGQIVGLVGESGCGKSVTAHAVLRLLPQPMGRISRGRVWFGEEDLASIPEPRLRQIRGNRIGMIFQEPLAAFNPVIPVGKQIAESLRIHRPDWSRTRRKEAVIRALSEVGIPAPESRLRDFPHQLSGGMRQRAMIALALICDPALLIADEPTTALDVTTQAQVLDLITSLCRVRGLSVLLITHDIGVIAGIADRVVVMYAGRIAESGPARSVLTDPRHRYTRALLECAPRLDSAPKTPLRTIPGRVPPLEALPVGARFAPRSDHPDVPAYLDSEAFSTVRPVLVEVSPGHFVEDCPCVRTDA